MSRENVDRVYAAFDAIQRHDVGALLAHLAPDVTITPLSAELEGTVHHGHEGVRVWLDNLLSVFSGYGPQIESVRDLGDVTLVAIRQQGQGVGSDAPITGRVWVVAQWSGDQVIAWRSYRDEQAALEAVGLSE